jgi:hypothetical protein
VRRTAPKGATAPQSPSGSSGTTNNKGAAGIRFGCATGKALCGNLGTDKIKRFCTVGPVVNHAAALLNMCRTFGVTNLIASESLKGMSFEYTCDNVTIGVLPHTSNGTIIGTIREKRAAKMDEWMYELQEGEESANKTTGDASLDTIVTLSEVLDKLMSGDADKANHVLTNGVLDIATQGKRVEHVKMLVALRQRGEEFPSYTA